MSKDHSNKRQLELQPEKTKKKKTQVSRTKPDFEYLSFSAGCDVVFRWVEMWVCCEPWVLSMCCVRQAQKRPLYIRIVHLRITETILIPLVGLSYAGIAEILPSLPRVPTAGLYSQTGTCCEEDLPVSQTQQRQQTGTAYCSLKVQLISPHLKLHKQAFWEDANNFALLYKNEY